MKKLSAILLSAALLAGTLTGCSNSGGGQPDPSDTSQTEFEILAYQGPLSGGYENNAVLNELQEKAGIKIKWNGMSESVGEQVNIKINGGDYPDAFMGIGFSDYDLARHGSEGTFIDLTPYITPEIMPNLSKILDEHPEIKSAITMADGKIYGLPNGEQLGTGGIGADENYSIYTIPQFAFINKAWLDDLGLEIPTTMDELTDVLQAFKDNDMSAKYYGNAPGSTIPLCTGYDQWCWGFNFFYAGFGFTNWPNDVCTDLVLDSSGKVRFVSTDDSYRDAVSYLHNWFEKGLMDITTFSNSDSDVISRTSQGQVGVSVWWNTTDTTGEHSEDYVYLPFLSGPDGTLNVTVRTGGETGRGQLSITDNCKSPANLLKFFDLWYDGETVMQLHYGPKDVYFNGQDEKGMWISLTNDESLEKFGKPLNEIKGQYEVFGPKLILAEYYNEVFYMEDAAVSRLTDMQDVFMPYVKDDSFYPRDCVFSPEELDVIDRYKADFESAVSEQEGLWIKNGGPTDEEWNAYKSKLADSCGMDELLKVYQAAYDRYASAK